MTGIRTCFQLEDFGRTLLSSHFFMHDFLHSEIAARHGLRNIPDDPARAAIHGANGAQALFHGKARINHRAHGDPLYVLIWQGGASTGLVLGRPAPPSGAPRTAEIPVARLQAFERQGRASQAKQEQLLR